MQAGREMDALVAINVFGFEREQQLVKGDYHGIHDVLYLEPEQAAYRRKSIHDCYWERWSPNGDEVIVSDCVPPYSTSIEAAWAVVEKMREKYDVSIDSHASSEGSWGCYISMPEPDERQVAHAEADTAPLAICEAALRAFGYQQEG